jgi:hypothetical protein
MKSTLLSVSFAVVAAGVSAQSAIDWFAFDAGGGAQSSANYVINSSASPAQVGPGVPSSANYRILPGFWALDNLGPATGLPELSITLSGANAVLSWPSPSTGFVLQHSDSLAAPPAAWTDTPGVVNDNGFIKRISIPPNLAGRFYRLRRP